MLFSSIPFLFFFLPLVLLTYFLVPRRFKNSVLLVFSLIFYAWGEPVYVLLMIASIAINYVFGLLVHGAKQKAKPRQAKGWLILSVVFNVGAIGFFKYADFVVANLSSILGIHLQLLNIPLPIGISFYTFQIMSYVIDLYWDEVEVEKNIFDLGTYIALFPQLIAGPIVRIRDVAVALKSRRENFNDFADGVRRFVTGLAKKVLLANTIGAVWSDISAVPFAELSVVSAWIGIIAFAFQIYFDFSAYSDMAIGLGKMFGFHFLENFNYPYIATSITEFWRRWHMSLSTWFRDYVYIPLGGSRKGMARQIVNLFIVWMLTGLWHGASWNFVLWGLYFCLFLILEKLFLLKFLKALPAFFGHVYTLFIVLMSWVLFSFESMRDVGSYLRAMFGGHGRPLIDDMSRYQLLSNALLFVILVFAAMPWPRQWFARWQRRASARQFSGLAVTEIVGTIILLILVTAHLVDAGFNPFLYFRF